MLPVLLALACILQTIGAQWVSPCPRLFSYEPMDPTRKDRWYGQIILQSDSDLQGVWLRVAFDKPTIQLGNWFGEVVRRENNEYLIKNPRQKLSPSTPVTVRFFVRYEETDNPPKFTGFRLNAKTYCPENSATTVPPLTEQQLFTNNDEATNRPGSSGNGGGGGGWNRPNNNNQGGGQNSWNNNNNNNNNGPTQTDIRPSPDLDVYPGDFSLINKPAQNGLENSICGTVIQPPRPLITHAQVTHEAEFPWHAALYHAAGIDLTYICGASLISTQHLITVAHCVTRRGSVATLSPDTLVVYLGKYYLKRWSNPGIQDRQVEKIAVHPNYNAQTYKDDIAIMKIANPVQISNYVRPVCLWSEDHNLDRVVGKLGIVAGWGYNESGIVTDKLMKANMPIVSQETCIYSFPDFFSRFTNNQTFCAGYRNGTSVCNGDSGGGMVIPSQVGSSVVYSIRGLISISVALQNTFKCDANHYVVFTDVAKYVPWIQNVLKQL